MHGINQQLHAILKHADYLLKPHKRTSAFWGNRALPYLKADLKTLATPLHRMSPRLFRRPPPGSLRTA